MDLQRQVNVENVDNLIQLCFSAVAKEDTDPKTTHEKMDVGGSVTHALYITPKGRAGP